MRTRRLLLADAWRSAPPSHGNARDAHLHAWLTSRGSLTARIRVHFANFNLVRLSQCFARPNRDEIRPMSLKAGELAIVREVLLKSGDNALVFAHTVAVAADLRGAWRGLSRLGARPLAEMLFHDAAVERLPIEYRQIDARHPLFRRVQFVAPTTQKKLWARRSVFLKRGRPLLVTEVFLEAMKSKL